MILKGVTIIIAMGFMSFLSFGSQKVDYSFSIKNVGNVDLWVFDTELYKINEKITFVGVGILPPGIDKRTHSFSETPYEKIHIKYKNEKTNKTLKIPVRVKLPIDFWANLIHHEIIIYINPEKESAKIVFSGYSEKDDKDYYVDSEGKPYIPLK